MNLHSIVAPIIGAVNPLQFVSIQISTGNTINADGTQVPSYATPGSITAAMGGFFTGFVDDGVLTATAVGSGVLSAGDAITGQDTQGNVIPPYTTVAGQLTGVPGGVGTYQLNIDPSFFMMSAPVTGFSDVLVVSAVAQGALQAGVSLAGLGVPAGLMVGNQLSGTPGGAGNYLATQQANIVSETMTSSMTILAQVQPLSAGELRHMDALNLQGSHRKLYFAVDVHGIKRPNLKGGDVVTLPDGSVWLVTQPQESFYISAGWTSVVITLQNGS